MKLKKLINNFEAEFAQSILKSFDTTLQFQTGWFLESLLSTACIDFIMLCDFNSINKNLVYKKV